MKQRGIRRLICSDKISAASWCCFKLFNWHSWASLPANTPWRMRSVLFKHKRNLAKVQNDVQELTGSVWGPSRNSFFSPPCFAFLKICFVSSSWLLLFFCSFPFRWYKNVNILVAKFTCTCKDVGKELTGNRVIKFSSEPSPHCCLIIHSTMGKLGFLPARLMFSICVLFSTLCIPNSA